MLCNDLNSSAKTNNTDDKPGIVLFEIRTVGNCIISFVLLTLDRMMIQCPK